MLDSTFELISLAASNSLAVFCFFNLIIVILLVGNSKPTSHFNEEKLNDSSITVYGDRLEENAVSLSGKSDDLIKPEEEIVSSVSITMIGYDEEAEEEEDEEEEEEEESPDEEDDDELRRRVEEFIEKTNRGWKAEKSKVVYALGQ